MSDSSIEQLIVKAQECIENANINEAMEFGKQILALDSENTKGLEIMGYILLELNCLEEAKFCFSKSIENKSNDSHVPYLYLGQLTEGKESEKYFLSAIELMQNNLTESESKKILFKPTKLDVSNAYVSLCELYMTDLCDEETAEVKCNEFIKKAIECDESNPAALQSLASLYLIKNEPELAKENIKKSINLWLPEALKFVNEDPEESTNEMITTCDLSAELRIKGAEILFELDLLEEARSVLDTILIEDDEHFQAHYLMACVIESMVEKSEENKEELISLIEDHAEMALALANPVVEKDAVEKMTSLLEKIGAEHRSCNSDCSSNMDDSDEEGDDDEEEMSVDKEQ